MVLESSERKIGRVGLCASVAPVLLPVVVSRPASASASCETPSRQLSNPQFICKMGILTGLVILKKNRFLFV